MPRTATAKPFLVSLTGVVMALAGCASAPQPTAPTRAFQSYCLATGNDSAAGIYRGIGSGASLPQAKQRAYADIAQQLSVSVRSDSASLTQKHNELVTTEWLEQINTQSSATLQALELDCLDKSDPGGKIHVALVYDGRPLATRYGERIVDLLGHRPRQLNIVGPTALTTSPFIQDLRRSVENPVGEQNFSSDILLDRSTNGWQLYVAEQRIPLNDQQLPYAINWQSLNRRQLTLYPERVNGQRLPLQVPAATEYRWQIKTGNPGYLHLLGVYQNGEVDILRQDLTMRRANAITIPESGGVWEAGLIAPDTPTTDSYIALVTDVPLTETALGQLLNRRELGADGSLNRFFQVIEQLDAAVGVVNLAVLP
ncbi:LPP20 family lipoprotein [Microbulbifer elongatus]|uniref:LPP20 family lipoprotein n=1 Tax=Microbulbifer elongatus TaxID=86173 RepID=A0ABT1P0Q8_9GAMM|nr:LPP20 family lipoprotein [Microbulbifer elongatus]MCQ3829671.1 LPP20 family lipoprotein [Microbulbifer elongatus]